MHHVFLVPFFFLLTCAGASPLRAQSYGERDTGFSLLLSRPNEAPRGIVASITTTSIYPCEGYVVRCAVVWTGDTATVMITGLRAPSPCAGGGAEATGTVFLGAVAETAFLRIDYRGDADLYRIVTGGSRPGAYPLRAEFTRVRLDVPAR